jgi:hypothetical protein
MKLAILQPVLLPDLQDLSMMLKADTIVYQDSEAWSRKGRTHRALIRTPEGTDYLNIPVITEDRKKPIRDVRIDHGEKWIEPILRSLEFNYRNSVYYDFYEPEIRADLESAFQFELLLDFSIFFRQRILLFLETEIQAKTLYSSAMDTYDSNPDILAQNLNADTYWEEHDSRHYMRQGVNKMNFEFTHPRYRQHFEGFEPDCCILDLLFQYGPESFKILDQL